MRVTGTAPYGLGPESGRAPLTRFTGPRPPPLVVSPASVTADEYALGAIRPEFTPVQPYLQTIHDAWLLIGNGNDGGVLNARGELMIGPSAFTAIARRPEQIYPMEVDLPTSDLVLDRAVLGFDAAWTNYYHWMFNGLGRSKLGSQLVRPDTPVVFPDYRRLQHIGLSPLTFERSIDLVLGFDRCLFLSPGAYRVRELSYVWTDPVGPTDLIELRELHDVFSDLSARLGGAPRRHDRRLYFTREGSASPRMSVEEGARLSEVLERHGFEKVFLERLSFEDQVRAAASAEAIVSPHGAGLSNLVFAGHHTLIIELQRTFEGEACPRPWFYQLASCRGQRYAGFHMEHPDVVSELDRVLQLWLSA